MPREEVADMRRPWSALFVIAVVSAVAAMAGAEANAVDDREVTWLRNGCEILLDEERDSLSSDETIDYWGPVCHGYALAAKDYALFVMTMIQEQQNLPVEFCYEPNEVTGREVARVFVDHVDRHPESRDKAAAVAMFDAVNG